MFRDSTFSFFKMEEQPGTGTNIKHGAGTSNTARAAVHSIDPIIMNNETALRAHNRNLV